MKEERLRKLEEEKAKQELPLAAEQANALASLPGTVESPAKPAMAPSSARPSHGSDGAATAGSLIHGNFSDLQHPGDQGAAASRAGVATPSGTPPRPPLHPDTSRPGSAARAGGVGGTGVASPAEASGGAEADRRPSSAGHARGGSFDGARRSGSGTMGNKVVPEPVLGGEGGPATMSIGGLS